MKRLKLMYLLIFSVLLIPFSIDAAGSVNVSPRNLSLKTNGSASFTITANNSVGRVDVSTSNSGVATVSTSSLWVENNSQTVTVRAVGVGTATINVRLTDVSTFDEEPLSGNYTVSVNVTAPNPVIPVNPNTNNKNNNNNNNNKNNNNNSNKSGNNNLKKIEVQGYKLTSKNNNEYSLTVKNTVEKIKIIADVADNKAKVTGAGEKKLEVGDNVFKLVVTAENGNKKTYTITVTRRDDTYYLDDLDDAISASKENIVITLKENDILTRDQLQKIKKANKPAYFVMKKDSKTLYSWMINSKNIGNQDAIKMDLYFSASDKNTLEKLTDYREGIYLNFSHSGTVPKDTVLRVYVGDKYKDGDMLHLYFLKDNEITFMKQEVEVSNGYSEITIDHCSDYFLTKATISGDAVKMQSETNIIPLIIMVILVVLIICVLIAIVIKNSSSNAEDKQDEQKEKTANNVEQNNQVQETVENNTVQNNQNTEVLDDNQQNNNQQ